MGPYEAELEAASGQTLKVMPNKSSAGLIALLEGRADLAMISAPLESESLEVAKLRPDLRTGALRSFEVTRTRVSFAVHPTNLVRRLELDVVRQLLLGQIPNWREVGGPDLPVRVVIVRDGGGVQTALDARLFGGSYVLPPGTVRVQHGSQVIKVVEQEPGALGVAQLGLVQARGLPEIVTDRPVEQQLSLVSSGAPTPVLERLIEAARRIALTAPE